MSDLKNGEDNDDVRIFVADTDGPAGFACFFEEEKGRGYLYVSDRTADRIIKHLQIYDDSEALLVPDEDDVRVFWSTDGTRCGVAIWGKMRGILDVVNARQTLTPVEARESPGVSDPEWLKGFDKYLSEDFFIRARQRYWAGVAREQHLEPVPEEEIPVQTNFIVYEAGPKRTFAVFEDEGETGYLYVYDAKTSAVLRYLHVYDRSKTVEVGRQDVRILWSECGLKCAVVIWDEMRGIIDLTKEVPGRVWLESRDTPGINDPEWLRGF